MNNQFTTEIVKMIIEIPILITYLLKMIKC